MSQHEIEDLAEDTVRLLLEDGRPRAERLRLIRGVYRFHDMFDTSDTIGRLAPELEAIGYFEATGAEPASLLETVAAALALAQARGDRRLGHHWLAAFVDAVESFELSDELPKSFAAFRDAAETVAIRRAAKALDVYGFSERRPRLRLKPWKRFASRKVGLAESDIARKHILRLLVDLDADEKEISAGYAADIARVARFEESPLFRLPEIMPDFGPFAFLGQETRRGGLADSRIFVFAFGDRPENPEATRKYLVLRFDVRPAEFDAFVKFQSGLLLGWRGRDFGVREDDMHFSELLAGMKRYAFDKPEKALRKVLAAIVGELPNIEVALAFHDKPLRALFESHDVDQLLARQTELRQEVGFLTNDFDVLFAYACLSWEKGERPDALIRRINERLPAVHDDYPLKSAWREGAEALKSGLWFPPLTERIRYRDLTRD